MLFKLKTDSTFTAKPFFLKKSVTFQTQYYCDFQSLGSMSVNAPQVPDVLT